MTKENLQQLKTHLLNACIEKQQEMIDTARTAIRDLQESAEEERSSYEDPSESYKAQSQNQQSMYNLRLLEANGVLTILERAKAMKKMSNVSFGALVMTDKQNFFIAASIGEFKLNGNRFFIISTQSPIYQAMDGKTVGDTFEFRGQKFKIKDIA